jgi:uncharacterized HAD superfamily protein
MPLNIYKTKGVAFDIDGVVADVMHVIRGKCEETFGRPYNIERETQYDLTWALGLPNNPEAVEAYVNHCLGFVDEIPIDPYTVKLTNALYDHTRRAIPFVTHRHRDPMMAVTYDLIESFIEVPYTISFAGGTRYQSSKKADYIPSGYEFVEDRRATAVELAEAGIFCWLLRTPYNKLDRTQQNSNIALANDLKDLYDFYF